MMKYNDSYPISNRFTFDILKSYINHGFLAVCHLPTISTDESWPKKFSEKQFFLKTTKNRKSYGTVRTIGYFEFLCNKKFIQQIYSRGAGVFLLGGTKIQKRHLLQNSSLSIIVPNFYFHPKNVVISLKIKKLIAFNPVHNL